MLSRFWCRVCIFGAALLPLTSAFAQATPSKEAKVPFGTDHNHPARLRPLSFSANAGVYSGIIQAIYSGYRWPASTQVLTFSFHTDSTTPFSNATKDNFRRVLLDVSRFIPIDFGETDSGDIRIFRSADPDYAYAYYPSGGLDDGDIYLRDTYDAGSVPFGETNSFQKSYGSHGFNALIHELGHALGLKHSFEAPACATEDDHQSNTVMTYTFDDEEPGAFMRYDIKTLQYLYGERSYHPSDDTYFFADRLDTFINSESETFYDAPYSRFKNILWDTGGIDTIDISVVPAGQSTRVDLREGGAISLLDDYVESGNQFAAGTALAYGVAIEHVVLSPGNDTVYLNDSDNVVSGYSGILANGNDTIWGASVSDKLLLTEFSESEITREQIGDDLVITLSSGDSVTIKGYSTGNALTVVLSDSVFPTPVPTSSPTPTVIPTNTPVSPPTLNPTPTPVGTPTSVPTVAATPSPTPTPDDGEEEVHIDLAQVGRVRRSATRVEIDTYTLDDEDEPVPVKRSAVRVSCTARRRKVVKSAQTDADGTTVVRLTGVTSGMVCRAEGTFFGQLERSNRVKLR